MNGKGPTAKRAEGEAKGKEPKEHRTSTEVGKTKDGPPLRKPKVFDEQTREGRKWAVEIGSQGRARSRIKET
eukprot:scaffold8350_cov89-Cylindrotheca_fusiformis.AAC.1